MSVGILAFHGDVAEHAHALTEAAQKLKRSVEVRMVRTKDGLKGLSGLILPGGESTTLEKLMKRAGMFEAVKRVPAIFGTCAGAILLGTVARGKARGQETLTLMDITVDRNAYGTQADSFEAEVETAFGTISATFIRAPRILAVGRRVTILAQDANETLAVEEKIGSRYYLAATFHPELSNSKFHEHFLKQLI